MRRSNNLRLTRGFYKNKMKCLICRKPYEETQPYYQIEEDGYNYSARKTCKNCAINQLKDLIKGLKKNIKMLRGFEK